PVVLPSRRRSSSRMRNGIVMSPTMCIPSTMSRIPPIRWSQYTRSPASAPTSAIATHRSVNTTLKPRTNASACATVRVRCVPASAASPAMFTRKAGTSGRTQGERNERRPAPKAIATFTRLAYLRANVDQAEIQMYREEDADPPAIVCVVGTTELRYHLRAIEDLHAMLKKHGDWMPLGSADEQKRAADGTVEAWGRSPKNPGKGWYGLKKGLRGRFGMYMPPLLEALGLAEVEHNAKNNRMRAKR